MQDFVPTGGGSLRARREIHAGRQVATFTTPATLNPDGTWERAAGHGFEHEPLDNAEKAAQHTVRRIAQPGEAFDLRETPRQVRSALRPTG